MHYTAAGEAAAGGAPAANDGGGGSKTDVDAVLAQCCEVLVRNTLAQHLEPVDASRCCPATTSLTDENQSPMKTNDYFFAKLLVDEATYLACTETALRSIEQAHHCVSIRRAPPSSFFPGTPLRALGVAASRLDAVTDTVDHLVRCVLLTLTPASEGGGAYIVRLAVPRAVTGSLIGKNGASIHELRVRVAARIHISPLFVSAAQACSERVIETVGRDRTSVRDAVRLLLTRINAHPSRAARPQLTYRQQQPQTSALVREAKLAAPRCSAETLKRYLLVARHQQQQQQVERRDAKEQEMMIASPHKDADGTATISSPRCEELIKLAPVCMMPPAAKASSPPALPAPSQLNRSDVLFVVSGLVVAFCTVLPLALHVFGAAAPHHNAP